MSKVAKEKLKEMLEERLEELRIFQYEIKQRGEADAPYHEGRYSGFMDALAIIDTFYFENGGFWSQKESKLF